MCGICGSLHTDGTSPALDKITGMMSRLERRGPDDGGHYQDGPVAFGHRRLAIIDLSARSHQPMLDAELGLAVVFNGTIYNYPQLRQQLQAQGYNFFSSGDTEVLLKAYHAWGSDCVKHLHGMFAFAIWDQRKRQLFLARDRMGIKPLYYSDQGNAFHFASTIPALLVNEAIDTSVDPIALHHQFTLHAVVPAPHTILNGVRKLTPGTTMTIDARGNVQGQRYWQLSAQRPAQAMDEREWTESIHDALRTAVKTRLEIADVPVGVLLSGGLDSSLLVALLAEAGVQDIRSFSIGFEDIADEKGSEFEYSDQVADRYGTRHQKIHIANDQVLTRLPEAVTNMAEPMVGQDAVAFYLLAEQVAREVKVVQSGQGADEVFAGYFWYPMMDAAEGSPLEKFRPYYFDRSHEEYLTMVSAAYGGLDYTGDYVAQRLQEAGADSFIDSVLRFDVTTLIVDDPVKRVDNMTMAWGLEARVPFLDQKLVELAAAMPPEYKLGDGGKYVLKKIARPLLPAAVIDRPKGYFPMPALKYVRGDFLEFMRGILESRACVERGLYQRDYVARLLAQPEAHMTALRGSKLWHLALLEYWMQQHVDTKSVVNQGV